MRSFVALSAFVAAVLASPAALITPAPLEARGTTIVNVYTTVTAPQTDCLAIRPGTTCIANTGPTATLFVDGWGANEFTTTTVYSTAAAKITPRAKDVTLTETHTVTVGPCAYTAPDPHQTLFTPTSSVVTTSYLAAATQTYVYRVVCTRPDGTFLNGCSWPTVASTVVGHNPAPTFAGQKCRADSEL